MNAPIKGRGALTNRRSRYLATSHDPEPAEDAGEPARHPATVVHTEAARTIISRNTSPDVPFSQSINPYRGCEHGCIYCFARPSHARLGHSPGLDFETQLYAKPRAAALLDAELRRPGYVPEVIHLGANTDPYQPLERDYRITRQLLEKLLEFGHPVTVLTKSALVLRDLDLLAELGRRRLTRVYLSITTLDGELKRTLEPRTASAAARLRAVAALAAAGVPTGVMVAPVIPAVNDHELEAILAAAAAAGARRAGWILLRLPLEVAALMEEWLAAHRPLAAARVMSLVRDARGGRANDPRFGHRMRGHGAYAELLARRFATAARRLGLAHEAEPLDATQFRPPSPQYTLF
jgi:DNA repair photolyase